MSGPLGALLGALLLTMTLSAAACGPTPPSHPAPSVVVGSPSPSASFGSPSASFASPSAPASAAASGPAPSASSSIVSPVPSGSGGPAPSVDEAALYDQIQSEVLAIRGLKAANVKRETIDEARLKALTAADFDKDNPPEYVAANERLFKALGLMPEDQSLKALFLDLVGSQVAGFYRPDAKKLYIVSRSGAINGANKITFAHEYDHALQDANFAVFDDQKSLLDKTDQALARAALYEGDATILMTVWAGPNLTPAELQEVFTAGTDPAATAILERTPAILREGLLFPYTGGVAFLSPIQAAGGWPAIDALYSKLPVSTEQVLHPEKYQAGEAPVAVELPANLAKDLGAGWSQPLTDTFGEFQMRVWMTDTGVALADATAAAAGWGGDRFAVLDGPGDTWGVVMRTAWDSDADAGAFEAAAATSLQEAGGRGGVFVGEDGKTRWVLVGSDDPTLSKLTAVLGLAG